MLNLLLITLILIIYRTHGQEESELSDYLCDYDINNDNDINVLDAVELVDYIIN
jgi:hypothetical protein